MAAGKGGKELFLIILSILIISMFLAVVSASVSFSEPKSFYNVGDEFKLTLTTDGSTGLLGAYLVCGSSERILHFEYLIDKSSVEVVLPLIKEVIGDSEGNCQVRAHFNDQDFYSNEFEVSKEINIELEFPGGIDKEFKPGESIQINGNAKRLNDELVNGIAEIELIKISVDETATEEEATEEESEEEATEEEVTEETPVEGEVLESVSVDVVEGAFSTNIIIPADAAPGTYKIQAYVYELDENAEKTNEGIYSREIILKRKPALIEIILVNSEIKAGSSFEVIAKVYDQIATEIPNVPLDMKVVDDKNDIIKEINLNSGEPISISIESNAGMGTWKILVTGDEDDIANSIDFYVTENEEASFVIENETLIVKNIGNVAYNKTIIIRIGEEEVSKEVNLDLGEEKSFELKAPKGTYDIEITDQEKSFTASGVALTGRAVSVRGEDEGVGGFIKGLGVLWVFVFIMLCAGIFIFVKKVGKKGEYGFSYKKIPLLSKIKFHKIKLPGFLRKKSRHLEVKKISAHIPVHRTTSDLVVVGESRGKRAEHSLIIKGQKQESSILALKIKNLSDLRRSNAIDELNKISEMISAAKGNVYQVDDYMIGLFVPSVTKTFKNEKPVIKLSNDIIGELKNYNRKFAKKIEFGVGINTGEIISREEKEKLLFTSLGNTISQAKRIADIAKEEALLSEVVHKRVIPEIKSEKKSDITELKVYTIGQIIERGRHDKFIAEFLNRQTKK